MKICVHLKTGQIEKKEKKEKKKKPSQSRNQAVQEELYQTLEGVFSSL